MVHRLVLNIPKVRSVVSEDGSDTRLVLLRLMEKGELRHTREDEYNQLKHGLSVNPT